MGLELEGLLASLRQAALELRGKSQGRKERLRRALSLFPSIEKVKNKAGGRSTWLMAELVEGNSFHPLLSCPPDYSVLAVDGSHIPPEPHSLISCYLINLGLAYLSYGQDPSARLESYPRLYYREEELTMVGPHGEEESVEGVLLGIKRSLEELKLLAQLLRNAPQPCLGFIDGSLIFWGLAGRAFPSFIREELLKKELLPSLQEMKEKGALVAGYISSPHSKEVVNLLRLLLCPHSPPDCDRHCRELGSKRPCQEVGDIEDRELFASLLQVGERSPLFASRSSVVVNYYGEHQVCFFYLRVQDEIARVEMPRWLAQDGEKLDLVHSLAFDQCRRGDGYPVALMEAHEQAVLSPGDRERFWSLMEESLAQQGVSTLASAKRRSKQLPWV